MYNIYMGKQSFNAECAFTSQQAASVFPPASELSCL